MKLTVRIVALLIAAVASALLPARAELLESARRLGTAFLTPSLQAQQADDATNPGMLWVAEGEKLWRAPPSDGGSDRPSCQSCHGNADTGMRGVAARYPVYDAQTRGLLNLELRINRCRTEHQSSPALAWESPELLALTAYVAHQSRGMPIATDIEGPSRLFFEAGQRFFTTRQGQLNVACSQCHDDLWGKRLRGDTISQGHPTGFPIYRIEWQTAGSLHRRLRACSLGVRAEVLDFGAPDYLALELYLAWRARGLPIESPAIRR